MIASVPFRLALGMGAAGLSGLALGYALSAGIGWVLVPAFLVLIASTGVLLWSFLARPRDEEARGRLDLIFGDMDDPVQRSVVWRTALAAIVQLVAIELVQARPEVWAAIERGYGVGAETGRPLAAAAFVLGMAWIAYEVVRFARIDEFWMRGASWAGLVGGAGFAALMTVWLLAGEVAGAAPPSFVTAYLAFWLLTGAAAVWHVLRVSRP